MLTYLLIAVLQAAPPQQLVVYGADTTMANELRTALEPIGWGVERVRIDPPVASGIETDVELLSQAINAYDYMLFEESRAALEKIIGEGLSGGRKSDDQERVEKFEPSRMGEPPTRRKLELQTQALVYLARVYELLEQEQEGVEVLDLLAHLQPDVSVWLERFPPDFRERVKARIGRLPARTGSLRVEVHPQGANVFINGRSVGRAPLVVSELPGGMHTVSIEMKGYAPLARTIEVKAGFGVGAEATPDLLEARLQPVAPETVGVAQQALSAGRLPDYETSESLRRRHKELHYSAGLFISEPQNGIYMGLLPKEGAWRGLELYPPTVLTDPHSRERLIKQVLEWLQGLRSPVLSNASAHDKAMSSTREVAPPLGTSETKVSKSSKTWWYVGAGALVVGGITAAAIAASSSDGPAKRGTVEISW